jgi:hypothetical protein
VKNDDIYTYAEIWNTLLKVQGQAENGLHNLTAEANASAVLLYHNAYPKITCLFETFSAYYCLTVPPLAGIISLLSVIVTQL